MVTKIIHAHSQIMKVNKMHSKLGGGQWGGQEAVWPCIPGAPGAARAAGSPLAGGGSHVSEPQTHLNSPATSCVVQSPSLV